METTTYKFNVNSNAFSHALDIFSQFFKRPLFDTGAIKREIMAVDAEDSKNRIIDARRLLQVLKHQIDPSKTDYSKFSTGNIKTLSYGDVDKFGHILAESIRDFHRTYYKPERMAVALVGPQSIEELSNLAKEMFADIPTSPPSDVVLNNISDSKNSDSNIFKPKVLGSVIRVRPIKDIREMSIVWQLPGIKEKYSNAPTALLSYVLGHKGIGSLFSLLQEKGWATSTGAGTRTTFGDDFSLFEVSVALTVSGLENWEKIVSLIYKQIANIRNAKDDKLNELWEELRIVRALDFQYLEKNNAYETAPSLAAQMLDYPLEEVLSAGYLLKKLEVSLLRDFLSLMTADRNVIFLRSQSFHHLPVDNADYVDFLLEACKDQVKKPDCESPAPVRSYAFAPISDFEHSSSSESLEKEKIVEPYYGVSYELEKFSFPEDVQESVDSLALPEPNRFLCMELLSPKYFSDADENERLVFESESEKEKEKEENGVKVLRSAPPLRYSRDGKVAEDNDRSGSALWFSRDMVFQQPRTVVYSLLNSPNCG